MPIDSPPGFPPGEIGARFNQVRDLRAGEFVYVRMEVWRDPANLDIISCKLLRPAADQRAFRDRWSILLVPHSQIVCREPKVMEADGGLVRAVSIEER
ncbi:hypothetical protein ACVWW6_006053 [Bradyrhizobium sp. USDA 3311]